MYNDDGYNDIAKGRTMEPKQPAEASGEATLDTLNGCAKGCVGLIAAIVVISVGIGLWSWLSERGLDDITMRGTVLVDEPCDFPRTLLINGDGLTLDNGRTTPSGCEYTFVTSVKARDTYTFETRGEDARAARHDIIDTVGPSGETELRVRLSW